MPEEPIARYSLNFLVYTGLGYLALALHVWVLVPAGHFGPDRFQLVLVLLNLAAGSWCFLRALRSAWVARVRAE